jgi:hypothetical protein
VLVSIAVERHPDFIIVNTGPYQAGFGWHPFDYIGYFEQDPRFARLMRNYAPIAHLPPFLVYGHIGLNSRRGVRDSP